MTINKFTSKLIISTFATTIMAEQAAHAGDFCLELAKKDWYDTVSRDVEIGSYSDLISEECGDKSNNRDKSTNANPNFEYVIKIKSKYSQKQQEALHEMYCKENSSAEDFLRRESDVQKIISPSAIDLLKQCVKAEAAGLKTEHDEAGAGISVSVWFQPDPSSRSEIKFTDAPRLQGLLNCRGDFLGVTNGTVLGAQKKTLTCMREPGSGTLSHPVAVVWISTDIGVFPMKFGAVLRETARPPAKPLMSDNYYEIFARTGRQKFRQLRVVRTGRDQALEVSEDISTVPFNASRPSLFVIERRFRSRAGGKPRFERIQDDNGVWLRSTCHDPYLSVYDNKVVLTSTSPLKFVIENAEPARDEIASAFAPVLIRRAEDPESYLRLAETGLSTGGRESATRFVFAERDGKEDMCE